MKHFLLAWAILAAAVAITAALFPGITVDWSPGTYFVIAAVFALVNLLIGPVLRLLSLPVRVATLGLFSLVINVILFMITAVLMDSLHVDTIWAALGGSAVISVVRMALSFLVDHVPGYPGRLRTA